jgi:hypothetical protein
MNSEVAAPTPKHLARLGRRLKTWTPATTIAALSTLSLATGGLLVIGFFVRIKFMPDFDLAGSSALLFAAALVGFMTILMATAIAAIPGVATLHLLSSNSMKFDRWATAIMILPGSFFAIAVVGLAFYEPTVLATGMPYLFTGAFVLAAALATFKVFKSASDGATRAGKLIGAWRVVILTFCAFLWLFSLHATMRFAFALANDGGQSTWLILATTSAWLIFVLGINTMTARATATQANFLAPVGGVLSMILLIVMTQNYTLVSATTVRLLGYGEIKNVDLFVKADICNALPLSSAISLRCAGGAGSTVGVLRNVTLRSRIGGQVLIEGNEAKGESKDGSSATRLVLRKDDVLMWTIRSTSVKSSAW